MSRKAADQGKPKTPAFGEFVKTILVDSNDGLPSIPFEVNETQKAIIDDIENAKVVSLKTPVEHINTYQIAKKSALENGR